MRWYKKLHWQIILAIVLGLGYGFIASQAGLDTLTRNYIQPFGTIFVRLLELIAVPLVLTSLIVGITNLSDVRQLSRMGGKTIGLYLVTTVFAITIGLIAVNLIKPGKVLPKETRNELLSSYRENAGSSQKSAGKVLQRKPLQPLVDLIPTNFFEAAADNGKMLQVVFVAILLGIGMIQISKEKRDPLIRFFDGFNDVILKIVDYIMKTAPIGVFALMGSLIVNMAGQDMARALSLLYALGWYVITIAIGLVIHVLVVYQSLLRIFGKMRFRDFIRGIRPAMLLGFSTSSSLATLPVTMDRVENNLGVNEEVAGFVLPVGATVNMDGTSLYQAVAAVFIAQALGLGLDLYQQITIVVTATLASIGAAGVPGAGIIMLVIVLKAIHVPVEGIALIIGVDRIIDMLRTAVNITGDAAVSVAVASSEGMLGAPDPDD